VLYLQLAPALLPAIELRRYEVPLIEPALSGRRRWSRRPVPVAVPVDTVPLYTPRELAQYDSLKNGWYVIPDSIRETGKCSCKNFMEYLQQNIRFTQSAIDHKEEGTIYMEFDIDSNGSIQNIVCVHGNCPAMALHVADVLARTPRIPEMERFEVAPPPRVTARYRLPVRVQVD
jgi:hypothetical protein